MADEEKTVAPPTDIVDNVDQVQVEAEEEKRGDVPSNHGQVETAAVPVVNDMLTLPTLPPLPPNTHTPDSPTTQLISTLRHQISLLTDQSTQLNTKLIASVSRVGDLEDSLESATTTQAERDRKIRDLETERAQWEESMNTGLLVEKATIKDEMQRLVEGMAEEERRRGSAEEGRQRVEREVDDLSASLFEQANTMVASERLHRIQAESRLKAAEENLAVAETAVQSMQQQLQSFPSLLLPPPQITPISNRRYMGNHPPFAEFITLLSHLRLLKPQNPAYSTAILPPTITSLVSQPFLSRTIIEDHDPTLRLDLAPDLNWLSRRSLNTAIMAGELAIDPVSASTLLASAVGVAAGGDIGCSMCGKPVFSHADRSTTPTIPPPAHPSRAGSINNSTSGRFSLKPFFSPSAHSPSTHSPSAIHSPSTTHSPSSPNIYVFRINNAHDSRMYPLCHTGWCLARLRAACELWRFVRSGILDVVWKGEDGWVAKSTRQSMPALPTRQSMSSQGGETLTSGFEPSVGEGTSPIDIPPRKRSGWGLGFKFGSRQNSVSAPTDSEPVTPNEDETTPFPVVEVTRSPGEAPVDINKVDSKTEDEGEAPPEAPAEAPPEAPSEAPPEAPPEAPSEAPPDAPPEAPPSPTTSHEPEFSTPKGLSPATPIGDLPEVPEEKTVEEETAVAETAVDENTAVEEEPAHAAATDSHPKGSDDVDLSSPRASMDVPDHAAEEQQSDGTTAKTDSTSLAAPPLPRRATRRRLDAAASNSAPTNEGEVDDDVPTTPNPSDIPSLPPRLPPRSHNRTTSNTTLIPSSPITPTAPQAEKSKWVEGDGWEAKTWKELVRLKEEMWMARVGAVDGGEN